MRYKIVILSIFALLFSTFAVLPAVADDTNSNSNVNSNTNTNTNASTKVNQLDVACIKAAVEKRDLAIITALNKYNTAIISALTTRKDALKAAWEKTDRLERRNAIREVWKKFTTARNQAFKDLSKAKKSAWALYRTERKTCKGTAVSDDYGSEGFDANL